MSVPIAAVSLTVGQFSWIGIFAVLRVLNHYRHRVDPSHRAIV